MLDTWWNEEDAAEPATQSLRCYSPVDFPLWILNLDLTMVKFEPGGQWIMTAVSIRRSLH